MDTAIPITSPVFIYSSAFLFGAIIGSFFNCLIHRLPIGQSLIAPASHCPKCKNLIRPYDNVPILSYILLRGKCRDCRQSISLQYPAVEIITTIWFCVLVAWLIHPALPCTIWEWAYRAVVLVFFLFFIPLIWIDAKHREIPDLFTLPGIVMAVAVSFFPGNLSPVQSLMGLLAGGAPLYLMGWIGEKLFKKGEAMGGGDIKMMTAVGALLGVKAVLLSLLFGSFLGAAAGLSVIAFRKHKEDHQIAFGPYLALGSVIAFFWGEKMIQWYFDMLGNLLR